jgi:predicted unusual protein kinase regulating ubiquinone biosynthesis (AarF/ABC1/UbiB family)
MLRSRYRRIVFFFGRMLLSFIFWDLLLPRIGLRFLSRRSRSGRLQHSAAAYRNLAVQMGGVLIKVGQFMSSRVDVLPDEITVELSGLQDEVPAVDFKDIRRVIEAEFGTPVEQKFVRFEHEPLAAASLGQAHLARISRQDHETLIPLLESQSLQSDAFDVVVKVQRPDIEAIINTDLAALRTVGSWLARYKPISRRADVPALLEEFTRILYEEIDYLAEGKNAETFAENFRDQPLIRVPHVVWSHTTKRVLTLENVLAIKITNYREITDAGVDRAQVASRLLDTYLQQIFEDGFFHADPHPGNLFVNPLDSGGPPGSSEWELTFIDFGMVGRLPPNLKEGLREMLIGVGTKDAARVVHSYEMLGILLPSADLEMLERAGARMFDRFWGMDMTELSQISPGQVREIMSEFRDLVYSMPFQVPHDLVLLVRTVGILSGMCTGLDPGFNVWDHLAPYAQEMIAAEAGPSIAGALKEIENLARLMIAMPHQLDTVLGKFNRGEIEVRVPEVFKEIDLLQRAVRQVAGGIIFAALLIGGIQLLLAGLRPFADILLIAAGLSVLWVIIVGIRTG